MGEALGVLSCSSRFNITSGPGGSPCPGATLPFSPMLSAGTQNINAGAVSALSTTISRGDGWQTCSQSRSACALRPAGTNDEDVTCETGDAIGHAGRRRSVASPSLNVGARKVVASVSTNGQTLIAWPTNAGTDDSNITSKTMERIACPQSPGEAHCNARALSLPRGDVVRMP